MALRGQSGVFARFSLVYVVVAGSGNRATNPVADMGALAVAPITGRRSTFTPNAGRERAR